MTRQNARLDPIAPSAEDGEARPARRRFGLRSLVAVGAASAVVAVGIGPAFAWTATFDDVGFDHPFRDEISWMDQTGITNGYPGSGPLGRDYRPGEPVTRQAMAAFMQRLYNLDGQTRYDSSLSVASTSSSAWAAIPGASITIENPAGVTSNLHVTFSGESSCYGGGVQGYCQVRILVDPPGAPPPVVLGPDDDAAAFDSTDNGTETLASWESHSMDRYDSYVGDAGAWTVTAEHAVLGAGVTFVLDDWVMIAETDLEATDFIS